VPPRLSDEYFFDGNFFAFEEGHGEFVEKTNGQKSKQRAVASPPFEV